MHCVDARGAGAVITESLICTASHQGRGGGPRRIPLLPGAPSPAHPLTSADEGTQTLYSAVTVSRNKERKPLMFVSLCGRAVFLHLAGKFVKRPNRSEKAWRWVISLMLCARTRHKNTAAQNGCAEVCTHRCQEEFREGSKWKSE